MKQSIHIKDTRLNKQTPVVMGILNVTPDSFSDGGQYDTVEKAMRQAEKMVDSGAAILDIGGYSSRPGAAEVTEAEELDRVLPVVQKIANQLDAILSVDTFRSAVAEQAVSAGAHIVNDISAGDDDAQMLPTVARLKVPYIAMHKKGHPQTMQDNPSYTDVVNEVYAYLAAKVKQCAALGIEDLILDVGFGFGKTIEHNYELLRRMDEFQALGAPLLAGLSRKSMIYKVLDTKPDRVINGTTFLHSFALQGGASILRVHDVQEAVECVELWKQLRD